MCGIVGIAGNTFQTHCRMFRDLLLVDTVRGIDSTGVLTVAQDQGINTMIIEKELGGPTNLWDWNRSDIFNYNGVVSSPRKIMLGHNRAATMGSVTADEAHPFEYDHVIGVHNGTLRDYSDLDGYTFNCLDSRVLIQTIANRGIKETWKSFIGAAAVVWYDSDEDTLNFARNIERPLYTAWDESKTVLFWASEDWMIVSMAQKHKIKLEKNKEGKLCWPKLMKPDTHFSFDVTNFRVNEREPVALEKKPVATGGNGFRTAGRVVGFRPNNYKGSRPGKKRNPQINTEWAKGTARLGKETRGVRFRLTSHTAGGYFIGWIEDVIQGGKQDSHSTIRVYPNSVADQYWLDSELPKDTVFITKARLRESQLGAVNMLSISSAHIEKAGEKVEVNEEEQEEEKLYKGQNGTLLSESEWKNTVNNIVGGPGCCWCGDPILIEDHKEHLWISGQDVLCPSCAKDAQVKKEINNIYNIRSAM